MFQRLSIIVFLLAVLAVFTVPTARANPGGGAAAASYAATGSFLRIEGIEGEARDEKHPGWIAVERIIWNITEPLTIRALREGQATLKETTGTSKQEGTFTLIRSVGTDKASPKLMESIYKSTTLGDVVFDLCRTDGDKSVYMRYVLKECFISSYTMQRGRTGPATETFTLSYKSLEWVYGGMDSGIRK